MEDLRQQWLEDRKTCIGGSDISAIMGMNPYSTSLKVWQSKKGLLPPREDTNRMMYGRLLEDSVAQIFVANNDYKIKKPNPYKIIRHKTKPYIGATIDRIILGNKYVKTGILEIKTTSKFAFSSWGNEIPAHYYLQLQHYLLVTGYTWGTLIVFVVDTFEPHTYTFSRDEECIKQIELACDSFWNYVELDIAPPIENDDDAQVMYPEAQVGKGSIASLEVFSAWQDIKAKQTMAKELEYDIERLKTKIKEYMKDSEILTNGEGTTLVVWRNNIDKNGRAIRRFEVK